MTKRKGMTPTFNSEATGPQKEAAKSPLRHTMAEQPRSGGAETIVSMPDRRSRPKVQDVGVVIIGSEYLLTERIRGGKQGPNEHCR